MKSFTAVSCALWLLFSLQSCGGGGGGGGFEPTPQVTLKVEPILTNVAFPADIAFAPDGRLFYSELSTGNVRIIKDGQLLPAPFITIPVPSTGGEGLVGIAFDPEFTTNGFVYLFHTHPNPRRSRVMRVLAKGDQGLLDRAVADGLPVGGHAGGRLLFAEDQTLLISTGDQDEPQAAQDVQSLKGKILRVTRDGEIPSDNPFPGSLVFALGFRNVFGMTLHPDGTLYASDNGPTCDDEVNRVVSGGNYGWREGQPCGDTDPAFIGPTVRLPTPLGVTAAIFYRGQMFPELENQLLLGDVNTGAIRRYAIDEGAGGVILEEGFFIENGFGPVLDIEVGPEGAVYFSTFDSIYRVTR